MFNIKWDGNIYLDVMEGLFLSVNVLFTKIYNYKYCMKFGKGIVFSVSNPSPYFYLFQNLKKLMRITYVVKSSMLLVNSVLNTGDRIFLKRRNDNCAENITKSFCLSF